MQSTSAMLLAGTVIRFCDPNRATNTPGRRPFSRSARCKFCTSGTVLRIHAPAGTVCLRMSATKKCESYSYYYPQKLMQAPSEKI